MLSKIFSGFSLAAVLVVFSSCDIIQEVMPKKGEEAKTFLIPKGQHESAHSIEPLAKNKIRFTVRFDESAQYRTVDPNNQEDINKLYGFSDCNSKHHDNSARFGWRWFDNQIQIFAYTYKQGKQSNKFITAVNAHETHTYELEAGDNKYVFRVNSQEVEMERGCAGITNKYKLFPYFGGDEPAPQQVKIVIQDLQTD